MNCPRCATSPLTEKERDGITIDICPQCRGVWLDRGELERLQARALAELEQATRGLGGAAVARDAQERRGPRDDDRGDLRGGERSPAEREREREALRGDAALRHGERRRDDDDDDDDDDRGRYRGGHPGDGPRPHGEHREPHKKRRWFEMFDLFD
jgi:Zn-finger nucleic acid-binding protein